MLFLDKQGLKYTCVCDYSFASKLKLVRDLMTVGVPNCKWNTPYNHTDPPSHGLLGRRKDS